MLTLCETKLSHLIVHQFSSLSDQRGFKRVAISIGGHSSAYHSVLSLYCLLKEARKIEVKLLVTLLQMLQTPIESFCSTVFFISIPSNAGINEAPSSTVISGKECSFLETLLWANHRFAVYPVKNALLFRIELSRIWTAAKILIVRGKQTTQNRAFTQPNDCHQFGKVPNIALIFSQSKMRHSKKIKPEIFQMDSQKNYKSLICVLLFWREKSLFPVIGTGWNILTPSRKI